MTEFLLCTCTQRDVMLILSTGILVQNIPVSASSVLSDVEMLPRCLHGGLSSSVSPLTDMAALGA